MSRPRLTLVVAASDSAEAVARLLGSPGIQGEDRLEVLVVHAFEASRRGQEFPRWIAAKPGSGVHRLRAIGLAEARGEIVAFTEDSCLLEVGFLDAWLAAFDDDPEIVAATGSVEPREGLSSTDLAVVLCEYAPFLSPLEVGSSGRLAGNNFAVRRTSVEVSDEVHEWRLSTRIAQVEAVLAIHHRRFELRRAIGDRLRCGLDYGRRRAMSATRPRRIVMRILGPAILASQMARLVLTLARKRRLSGRFLSALPVTFALLAAWSVGEWLGWLSATPIGWRRPETAAPTEAPALPRGESRPGRCTPSPRAA